MPCPSEPADRRTMYARIACATHLPAPKMIHFNFNGDILSLSFDTVAEAEAWTEHFGDKRPSRVHNGHRYVDHGVIAWGGWQVLVLADEPAELAAKP